MQNDNTLMKIPDGVGMESVKLLISRLERLSADSRYAHRASGLRGSLWRCVEEMEMPPGAEKPHLPRLEEIIAQGYEILEAAAREINAPEK
jgi:hypothetical protein